MRVGSGMSDDGMELIHKSVVGHNLVHNVGLHVHVTF
jgi:hypothetical protein